jgi:release factor glutamine methyltransferase
MTVREALKKYHKIEIELLLAHVLRKSKEFIFMNGEKSLSADQLTSLSAFAKRRMRGEPIAYILGYKDFYGLRFKVNRHVLIPRPETEMVVDLISAKLRSLPPLLRGGPGRGCDNSRPLQPLCPSAALPPSPRLWRAGGTSPLKGEKLRSRAIKVFDIGTGSGCIAVSLAKQFSIFNFSAKGGSRSAGQFSITASDVSAAALNVARQNAKSRGVKVKFVKSDLLKSIKGDFDVIIANLPYLAGGWKKELPELKFEPGRALFTREKGLYLYRKLLEQIAARKSQPKLIFLEFDPRQKRQILLLIKKYLPQADIKFHKDFNNFWRWAEISF